METSSEPCTCGGGGSLGLYFTPCAQNAGCKGATRQLAAATLQLLLDIDLQDMQGPDKTGTKPRNQVLELSSSRLVEFQPGLQSPQPGARVKVQPNTRQMK